MTLADANLNINYKVKNLDTEDEELENFLLTLGVFEGETISLVTTNKKTMTIVVRDVRYTVDLNLASAILLQA